jgi:hypothetical protein
MIDHQLNQQGLPSRKRMKQIKAGWEERVKILQDAIATHGKINERRDNVTILKAFDVVKELQGRQILRNSAIFSKEELDTHLVAMKTSLANDFENLVEFPKEKVKQ